MDLSHVQAGDVIGVADDGWLSRSIRRATGNGPVSHIMIVTAIQPFVQVTEALKQVVVNPLEDRLSAYKFAIAMKPPVTDADRITAVRIALTYVGRFYNYGDLLLQELDSINQTRFWTDHFADQHEPICSMLAALAYPSLHLDTKSQTPNDFYNLHWTTIQLK